MRYFTIVFRSIVLCFFLSACGEVDKNTDQAVISTTDENPIVALNNQIEKEGPKSELLLKRAQLFFDKQNWNASNQDLFMLLQVDSTNLQAHHLLADVYLQKLNSQKALQTMERAILLYPDSLGSFLKLSEIQLVLKQYEASMQTIGKILEKDANNAQALFMLGLNYKDRGQKDKAIAAFQSAVEKDPTLIDGWIVLGNYMEEINPKLAEQYYDNATRMGPNDVAALHSKAFFFQNTERIPEALELYQKVQEIAPEYSDAYLNSAILYLYLDSLPLAKHELDFLIAQDKTSAYGHFYMGRYYELLNDPTAAKLSYETALKWHPSFQNAKDALLEMATK